MSMPSSTPTPERILQRLDWQVIRRLDGLLQGDYRSLFYGYGIDFADLREYQPEDDIRYIDWNVTARMDTPYVRQYVEDREITAWFLLDLSPSIDFGTTDNQKRMVLVDFVTPLAPLLQAGLNAIKQRSLVFIISDFISLPGWEKPLALLNQRHEVLAVRLWDPRETELPDVGPIIMEDAETGEQLYVDTHDRKFRQRFKQAAQERETQLAQSFKHAGVDALSLSTEEDLV